jgi:LPS O-antigen subunit length determinant protein (WzzB/FepE family)
MALLRFLLVAFNVAVVTFLIYRMLQVIKQPMDRSKKIILLMGGIILLLVPFGIFFRIFIPTPQYFIIYPVAIFFFLYLTRQL